MKRIYKYIRLVKMKGSKQWHAFPMLASEYFEGDNEHIHKQTLIGGKVTVSYGYLRPMEQEYFHRVVHLFNADSAKYRVKVLELVSYLEGE